MKIRSEQISPYSILFISLCTGVIAVSLAYSFTSPLGLYDEGFSLTNAWRILNGDIPHKDYWAAYPPGTSLVLAIFFFLFEPSLIVARIVNLGWTILLLSSLHLTLKQFITPIKSFATTAIASLWISSSFYPSYSTLPALALVFFVFYLYLNLVKTDKSIFIVIGGVIAGLIVLFRHDFAAYLYFSLVIGGITSCFIPPYYQENRIKIRNTFTFLILYGLVTLTSLIILLWISGWDNFIQQAIIFPATGMREYRQLPIPSVFEFHQLNMTWVMAWMVPFFITLAVLYLIIFQPRTSFKLGTFISVCISMSFFLTLQGHSRLDLTHSTPSVLFAASLLLVILALKIENKYPINKLIKIGFSTSFLIITLNVSYNNMNFSHLTKCITNRASKSCLIINNEQLEVVNYIQSNFGSSEYVFVGNTFHDRIFMNDASLYFLLKKQVPIKWNEMHPGIVTTKRVQENIIEQLKIKNVKIAVLVDMPTPKENNRSAHSSNVFLLDNFIKKHYQTIFTQNNYSVLHVNSTFD